MGKLVKEDLLNDVYDLVLSAETKEEERQVLLVFKNAVEAGKDFDESVVNLASDLRKIGIKIISKKTQMSPNVNDFYKKISGYGLFEENLARGLVATGVIFH